MFRLQHTPGRIAIVDGKEYLFFSGYAYLGMHHLAEFTELVKEGIDRFGNVFPSSRISNTQLDLLDQFEDQLSQITGTDNTVCFSSGFLAAKAVLDVFKGHDISCAPHTHPALCSQPNDHSGFKDWVAHINDSRVIAFDAVNPLSAEVNDTSFLHHIDRELSCIVDDSHGAGLLNKGRGVSIDLPRKKNLDHTIVYSLSKAYNLSGGAVSCGRNVAAALRSTPLYTASTSLSPAFAYAFLGAQQLYEAQRDKLNHNIRRFTSLTGGRYKSHPELPIFVLPDDTDVQQLTDNGIIISSFAYPDPAGNNINRVVISALHTAEDLERLAAALAE